MEFKLRFLTLCYCVSFVLTRATSPLSENKQITLKPRIARNAVSGHHRQTNFLFMRHVPPNHFTAGLHENWVLECEAGGSPPPTIHWLKNGVRVTQNIEDISEETNMFSEAVPSVMGIGSTKSRLFLDCAAPQAEGEYTCVAETPYQRVSATSNVVVAEKKPAHEERHKLYEAKNSLLEKNTEGTYSLNSLCVSAKKSLGTPARINMWTGNMLETVGNDVLLFCRATGTPTPSVNWLMDEDHIIDNGVKYQLQENGDLLIRDIDWNDMGVYSCVVSNNLGRDTATTFLYPVKNEN